MEKSSLRMNYPRSPPDHTIIKLGYRDAHVISEGARSLPVITFTIIGLPHRGHGRIQGDSVSNLHPRRGHSSVTQLVRNRLGNSGFDPTPTLLEPTTQTTTTTSIPKNSPKAMYARTRTDTEIPRSRESPHRDLPSPPPPPPSSHSKTLCPALKDSELRDNLHHFPPSRTD